MKSPFVTNRQEISFARLKSVLCGCAAAEKVDDALVLRRAVGGLAEFYDRQDGSRIRLACASGVRLRFISNARRLTFALRFGEVPWPQDRRYQCDLVVDGRLRALGPTGATGPLDWTGEVKFREARRRHFELWFCHVARVDLRGLTLEACATFEPWPAPARRWLVYGDSITQGMQATRPTRNYPNRLARALNLDLHNLAVGGATLIPELAAHPPAGRFDVVSLAYGTNDCTKQVPPDEFAANGQRLIAAVRRKSPKAAVVLIGPPQRLDQPPAGRFGLPDYRQALAELASQTPNARYVSAADLLPAEARYYIDQIHPNDAGFAGYARGLKACLRGE